VRPKIRTEWTQKILSASRARVTRIRLKQILVLSVRIATRVKGENLLNETNVADFPLIAKIGELFKAIAFGSKK
jgi:hypothetical protein